MSATLTPREWETLWYQARGDTWDQICAQLGIARCTLHSHTRNRRTKLGVTCLVEELAAVGWLVLPPEPPETKD